MQECPLCSLKNSQIYFQDQYKIYSRCARCELVFAHDKFLPTIEEEENYYQLHENDPNDHGYQKFMNRLLDPMRKYLTGQGLDYGCGPGPIVSSLLPEFSITQYDPIFYPEAELLERQYDFIIATEVFEHIFQINDVLEKLINLLKKGGILGVMTSFYPPTLEQLKGWGYKNDPTHVRFFNANTFRWIGQNYELEILYLEKNVVILKKV